MKNPSHPASNFRRLREGVDVSRLLTEVDAASQMWLSDTSRQRKVRCQRHTRNIFLRVAQKPLPAGAKNANNVHESVYARNARRFPNALKFLRRTAVSERATLGRATLVALPAGKCVYPHRDAGDYYRVRDRYHLVLRSPQGSLIRAGHQTVVMREGELWVFNNKIEHAARNPAGVTRIHLIFDLLPLPGHGHYVDLQQRKRAEKGPLLATVDA